MCACCSRLLSAPCACRPRLLLPAARVRLPSANFCAHPLQDAPCRPCAPAVGSRMARLGEPCVNAHYGFQLPRRSILPPCRATDLAHRNSASAACLPCVSRLPADCLPLAYHVPYHVPVLGMCISPLPAVSIERAAAPSPAPTRRILGTWEYLHSCPAARPRPF